MTNYEIDKNNRLIAEFMGGKFETSEEGYDYCELPNNVIGLIKDVQLGSSWVSRNFKFHSSFDWLMPVVKRIDSLDLDCIDGDPRRFYFRDDDILTIASDINVLYTLVIKFIKWYNENNN